MPTLILKALTGCNLRCAYCSVGDKSRPRAMNREQMLAALRFFAQYVKRLGEAKASVIFHGGEPMLLPVGQYDYCAGAIRDEFQDLDLHLSMQSNGVLLDEAWLDLLERRQIGLGLSIDGGRAVHDGQRWDASGAPTWQRIINGLRRLRERGLYAAALMVVTKAALEADLDFLQIFEELQVPLKINPLLGMGEAIRVPELFLGPGDYGRYLARVFRYAAAHNLSLRISPLAELVSALLNREQPRGCTFDPHCSRHFMSIDPEGNIYPCGHFADEASFAIGTVEEGVTQEGAAILDRLEARRTCSLPEACRACRERFNCSAGCSCDRLTDELTLHQPCSSCEDIKYILNFLRHEGADILKEQLLAQREELLAQMEES